MTEAETPRDPLEPIQQPIPRATGRPKGSKHSQNARQTAQLRRMLEMRVRGVQVPEIAGALGLSERTVRDRLEKFVPFFQELVNVAQFQPVKAQVFDACLLTFLKSAMAPDKLDKASVNNLAYAARQVFDMARLERGLSTSNTSIRSFVEVTSLAPELSNTGDVTDNLSLSLPASDVVDGTVDNTISCSIEQGAGGSAAGHFAGPRPGCDKPLSEIATAVKGSGSDGLSEPGSGTGDGADASAERKVP